MYGLGMAKGMLVTLKNFVLPSRMFTIQYPDRRIGPLGLAERSEAGVLSFALKNPGTVVKAMLGLVSVPVQVPQHSRFRGEEFTWYEERCTGCASCAKYCPLGIIKIVTSRGGRNMAEGESYELDVFDIDIGRCMFCGLCVQACPYDALHMGSGFEEGRYRRDDLVISMERLKAAPKKPSTWYRPQIEGKGYDAHRSGEAPWREVGRHERPTVEEQEQRWVNR